MNYEIKTKKLPKSEVEIEVALPADFLAAARKKAIAYFNNSLEIAGFRKGHIPENIILEKVGEDKILSEAADILLSDHFPIIIKQEKFDIIGRPKISITKLAWGNPVQFKAVFAVMPDFEIPDYRAIARSSEASAKLDKKEPEASEKEVDDVLLQIRKNKAHFDYHKNNPDEKDHSHQKLDLEKEENLPPLDDKFAQEAGNFKDLNELKEKIKENIINEKKFRETEKRRAQIMEELVKKTKIDLPEILIESEIEKSLAQLKDDVAKMGAKWEDYLKHAKKEEADLRKDLRESSEKRAKIQIIFNKIAEIEKLEPNKEILENEVKHLKEHYPEAADQNLRIYVSTLLLNQEVLKLLEQQ